MSVSIEAYLIAGVSLGKPKEACNHPMLREFQQPSGWETLELLKEELSPHLELIVDGYSAEYAYAGVILAHFNQEYGLETPIVFDPSNL